MKDVPTSVRAHTPTHTHTMHSALGYWNRVVASARWIHFFVRARCVMPAKMNGSTCLMYSRIFCVKPFHCKLFGSVSYFCCYVLNLHDAMVALARA